jgi:uncharacterized protein YecT (DUF1311 family)
MSDRQRSFLGWKLCGTVVVLCVLIPQFPLVCQSGPASARDRQTSGAGVANCSSAHTQYELNVCTGRLYERADAQLNALYKKVLGRLEPAGAARLVRVQRLWLRYRDAQCSVVHDLYAGGSIQPAATNGCLRDLTEERISDLKHAYVF